MAKLSLGYVNFFITDYERSLRFFRDQLGLTVIQEDETFGYVSFKTGLVSMAFARVDITVQPELVGRHTGIGLMVEDVFLAHQELLAAGVEFVEAPVRQPWGGVMGLFRDPDGNIFTWISCPPHDRFFHFATTMGGGQITRVASRHTCD